MKFLVFFLLAILLFPGCDNRRNENRAGRNHGASIVVFIPGVLASAIYQMLADGVTRAAAEFAASNPELAPSVTVIEGGFNQAGWQSQISTLAASGDFDLIVSSNPSMPDIITPVSAAFPNQKFLLLDAELAGNPNVFTLRYNQREQGFMAGYIAALAALEAGGAKRIGLVAGQEYPAMNNIILPGYTEGARAVHPDFEVDFRIVGNWFDAARAAELAGAMIRGGAGVLLPIAGGAGHGVIQAAYEAGAKVVWFDTNGYALRPGTVIGSAILRQDRAAFEKTKLFLEGNLPFGRAEIVGTADGFVDFIDDDPLFIAAVSENIRERMSLLTARFRSGELQLEERGS